MNVAFDPWIPVVTLSGERTLISLKDVFTEGDKYSDLAVRPHERVSLMRLFLCVTHAALNGPKDYDEWCEAPKRLPEAAINYLSQNKDAFELFHKKKPWLQVAELRAIPPKENDRNKTKKGWSPLTRLCLTRASGNNSTLFDHESNSEELNEFSNNEIALNLITFQNFFVAGGKASSRLWGNVEMNNPPNPKGGPCSGKSILFSFLRGKNIAESTHLNLNTYEDLKLVYGDQSEWVGKPIWEMPIQSPSDEAAIYNATHTHIGRLVPQTRILRVHQDRKRVLFGAGFLYPKFQDTNNTFHPDIFATTFIAKNDHRELLSARPNKAIWRELHAIVVRQAADGNTSRGPLTLLNVPRTKPCDIIVNAMMTNPEQAADILDLIESVFYIPSQLSTKDGRSVYQTEVKQSESLASRLGWAIETYRKEIDGGWEGRLKSAGPGKGKLKARLHSIATTHYWTAVEKSLHLLMRHIEAIGSDEAIPTREAWRKMIFSTACEAYTIACRRETPRQIRAFSAGWRKLVSRAEEPELEADNSGEEDA